MGVSEIPPPPESNPGNDLPELRVRPPGPQSRTWLTRMSRRAAPMGPKRESGPEFGRVFADVPHGTVVLSQGRGSNVIDVDSNRYVDLAAGFGSLLLGHAPESVLRAVQIQSTRLMQAMGDVYPSDAKIGLLDRVASLHWDPNAQVILGQSGADAITAALKTAVLKTGKAGVIAFSSSYHGLGYGALAVSNLRPSYREPFAAHLARDVTFCAYPDENAALETCLASVQARLARGDVGAIIVEPILGRGGVVVPPAGFLKALADMGHHAGALVIADEIWTGLGRTGRVLASHREEGFSPDLICIGKGLGGGLPISACLGAKEVMAAWSRPSEVVHTSTFAGAPLACAAALATLDTISRGKLVERAARVGDVWLARLRRLVLDQGITEVRGSGLMIGLDASSVPGGAGALQRTLLTSGFITSTGGGRRDVLVLTPPLTISEELLEVFDDALLFALGTLNTKRRRS